MGTTAQKLQNIVDTKAALSALIKDNGGTVPVEFRKYPDAITPLLGYTWDDIATHNYGSTITLNTYDISQGAFAMNNNIRSVTGNNVTNIGLSAFYDSTIYYANFPNVYTIGNGTFYKCDSLQRIDYPKCRYSGHYSFAFCKYATYINMPLLETGNAIYPDSGPIQLFWTCSEVSSINVPKLRNIGAEGFGGMYKIKNIDLPSLSAANCNSMFWYDKMIETINMPDLVNVSFWKSENMFKGVSTLKEFRIPKLLSSTTQINDTRYDFFQGSNIPRDQLSVYINETCTVNAIQSSKRRLYAPPGTTFICSDGIFKN